jgi:hypothetical protein
VGCRPPVPLRADTGPPVIETAGDGRVPTRASPRSCPAPHSHGTPHRPPHLRPGLVLEKQTAPIGVLLVIFEARPDALPQIAALALRSGNGLLLKGGKEAARSNAALHRVIVDAIGAGLGPDLIALVTSRDEISDLLKLHDVIDLVIPRGSNELVSHIQVRQSRRQGGGGGGAGAGGRLPARGGGWWGASAAATPCGWRDSKSSLSKGSGESTGAQAAVAGSDCVWYPVCPLPPAMAAPAACLSSLHLRTPGQHQDPGAGPRRRHLPYLRASQGRHGQGHQDCGRRKGGLPCSVQCSGEGGLVQRGKAVVAAALAACTEVVTVWGPLEWAQLPCGGI